MKGTINRTLKDGKSQSRRENRIPGCLSMLRAAPVRRYSAQYAGMFQRGLAFLLCAALLVCLYPLPARAEGTAGRDGKEQQIRVTDLEEMEEPETYPAKGTLCLQVARSKHIDPQGGTSYQYEEAYLPVLVAEDRSVYGDLDILCALLGMKVRYYTESVSVSFYETNILMAPNDTAAGYTTPLYSVLIEMGRAPAIVEEKWYVPLDAFLNLTGTLQKYGTANWLGKKQLNLIPPQRTVLDDMGAFYRDAYSKYAFSYVKDLGYTEETAAELAGQSSAIQYIYGIGSLDLKTWLAIAFGSYTDQALTQWEDRYAEIFMTDLLQENEDITVSQIEDNKQMLDYMGCMLDICMSVGEKKGAGTSLVDASQVKTALTDAETALKLQGADNYIGDFGRYISAYQNMATGLSHLYSLVSLGLTFGNADERMVEAAEDFYEHRMQLAERTVREEQYRCVKQKIDQFGSFASESAVDQFIIDDGPRLFLDVAAMAGYGAAKKAAGGSALWSAAARIAGGKWIDASESFLVGMFGMQYEADAVALARQELDRLLAERKGFALQKEEETYLRGLFFHAMKACIITRSYGCAGCPALLEKYPEIAQEQAAVNEKLTALAARINNRSIPFGRFPAQLILSGLFGLEHSENVLYNFCSIQGQILDWEDEKPAKNVRVEVMDKGGEKLAEFVTDENGRFEAEFALEEVNAWEETPLVQELTLHLYYKRHPVILEEIALNYFHRYEIEGLHVGKKTQETLVYVTGASAQDGQTVMDITRIYLDEDVLSFEAPDGYGGSYTAYAAMPGQMKLASDGESVLLEEGMEFDTLYGLLMPEGSLTRGLLDFADEVGGFAPEGLTQASLSDAQEIQDYVDAYYEINGQYPTFLLKTINSLAVSAEPVAVVADEADILH